MAEAREGSSRFVSVDCSLEEFINQQDNKNTLSKTQRDISLLKKFLVSNNEPKEIENIDAKDLDDYIANFLLQVRKQNGEQYEPTSLRSFISSFDRYLRKKEYPSTIIEGKQFRKTKEVLVAKQKELKKAGKGNKPNAARTLTDEEVDILYGQDLLGCSTSESLINTLWLNNTQFFGLRGCQEHRDMRWGDIEQKTTTDGTVYLEYNERQTKTRTGADPKDSRTVKPKMFAVAGSERDPLRAYQLYVSKRPDDMKTPESAFYLAINHTTKAVTTKPWFKSAPMGVNKLNSLMKTMAKKAGLNAENLTNHSGRKRMIQKLNDRGVPPTHIMQISGHKNVQSLNNYSNLSERQQRNISDILSYPGPSSSASIYNALTLNATKTVQESTLQQPLTLFQGASIQGGTFNISVNALNQSPTLSLLTDSPKSKKPRRCFVIESDSD
ncbi:MAG: hypothetical protein DSY43_06765 [Gammaproteobacteria bacterium]|nr:MAG: hypothetical protein DSY43_06765 [Gammaproteobacteria bacterium]